MARSALSSHMLCEMQESVSTLSAHFSALVPYPNITPSQAISLCAPKDDRVFLLKAPTIGRLREYGSEHTQELDWPGLIHPSAKVTICLENTDALLPKYAKFQGDADPELVALVTQWVNHQLSVRRDFGRIKEVLRRLDKVCTSPSQVRYVFPSMIALLKMSDTGQALAEELADIKQSKTLPSLAPDLREACRLAASTVTAALLIDEPPARDDPRVTFYIPTVWWEEPFATFM